MSWSFRGDKFNHIIFSGRRPSQAVKTGCAPEIYNWYGYYDTEDFTEVCNNVRITKRSTRSNWARIVHDSWMVLILKTSLSHQLHFNNILK